MFKRILVPTDGSDSSKASIQACIKFAKEINAEIVGIHVIPEFDAFVYSDYMPKESKDKIKRETEAQVEKFLVEIQSLAQAAGVKCETSIQVGDYPHEVIVKAAKDKGCDLIAMASHGRKGIKGLLLGSETQKVLTHSEIPVLIFR